uniref:Lipocalin n=1 Tax=Rhipicephalus zambeziensis TaxID=60191 RepID=A0A224YNT4_9ACAR
MLSLALCMCMLVVASADGPTKKPNEYAENQDHFSDQILSHMTDVSEKLFVRQRDYDTNTTNRCHSAKKVESKDDGTFTYQLSTRTEDGQTISFIVPMTPTKTGQHQVPNAAKYDDDKSGKEVDHKLMTMDSGYTCFVFSRELLDGNFGCVLAQTWSTVDNGVPEKCQSVYNSQCGKDSVTLYDSSCKTGDQ